VTHENKHGVNEPSHESRPEGFDSEDGFSTIKLSCPRCGTLGFFPLQSLVAFPDDARAILDLVSARLNVRSCRVCSLRLVLEGPLVCIDREQGRIAVAGFDETDRQAFRVAAGDPGVAGAEILEQADREELRTTIAAWTQEYLARSLAPFLSGSRPDRDADGLMAHQRPLVLLTLRRMAASELPFVLQTDPPIASDEQARVARDMHTEFVVSTIDGLFTYAFHHGGITRVPELLERHVPIECLDENVLVAVSERCVEISDDLLLDPQRMDTAFRFEYLCAAAHAAAQRASPRGPSWASLSLILFMFSRQPNVVVDGTALLDTSVLNRTIPFELAWNVANSNFPELVGERRDDVQAWFEHIGWGARYFEEWASVPIDIPSDAFGLDDRQVAEWVGDRLAEVEGEESLELVPWFVAQVLARAGRSDGAAAAVIAGLDNLAAREEWERVGSLAIKGSAVMNQHLDYANAEKILSRHFERILERDIPCKLRYSLYNEMGNVMRYDRRSAAALETYDEAAELMAECDEVRAVDISILRRNRAIVLRELNSFDRATSLLEQGLREDDPEDVYGRVSLLVSLARTYIDSSLPERALPYAEQAVAIPLAHTHAAQRIQALLVLAAARSRSFPGVEIPEFGEALTIAETLPRIREVAAASTLFHARNSVIDEQVIAKAHAILEDEFHNSQVGDRSAGLYLTAAWCLADWALAHGDAQRAHEILVELRRTLGGRRLPWMVPYLEARLPQTDSRQAWALMREVLAELDGGVPDAAGITFAAGYMTDKSDVQRFLLETLRSALEAGHATATDAVSVFEFLNAREMRGGTEDVRGRDSVADPSALLDRLRRAADELPACLLLILEYQDEIQGVWVRLHDGSCSVVKLAIDAETLRAASTSFVRRAGVLCLTDKQMRALADTVEPVLVALGEQIADFAAPGEHVCISPSPTLLGLPLHAARRADGQLLLEQHSISVVANLSVLCRVLEQRRSLRTHAGTAMAVVCKQGDRDGFVARALTAAERLRASTGSAQVKIGTDASKDIVLEMLESSEHFIFVGHGARSLQAQGRGLCVAADDALPNALLPVEVVPELHRFLIDASDLEALHQTPAMVASMACSSGRSFAGVGGTRLGLERSLFTRGTRTILAPLWDVNESSALDFLETFYELWARDPQMTVAEAHRGTCLAMASKYAYLFLWAPFALNGAWA
jgi:CHAT domain-containing protein/tetratricopeptide (TPR) repeat protein